MGARMRAADYLKYIATGVALTLPLAGPVAAQGLFSPVIEVNGAAVTGYELDQRARLLSAFNTPGDTAELARTQLVEERLKLQQLETAGMQLTDEGLETAMAEFATRANLSLDQFVAQLGQQGIARETLRDYVLANVSWRDYIRRRYNDRVQVSDAEIDAALGQGDRGEALELLLSEIIIAAPPPRAAAAMARAEQISRLTSTADFEAEARQVSALAAREAGGRLDWLPITNYPAGLRALLRSLAPGEVTPPIPIPNGVALFQLRDIRETAVPPATITSVDYATFAIAGGTSPEALAEAARISSVTDTCDDLYGVAKGLPAERLTRQDLAPAQIPQDIALRLAGLDANESTIGVSGDVLQLVMLCGRTTSAGAGADREAVANQLRARQLNGYADALLAELRASATITQP